MRIAPALKGLITTLLMIGIFLGVYYSANDPDPRLQYIVYAVYALGIAWTVVTYRQSTYFTGKFGDVFSQGFRCFVIVVLGMALFYGIFNYMHPEFAEQSSMAYREHLLEQVKNNEILPSDVEPAVSTYKKQFILKLVSGSIFGYLIIGAGVTALLSVLLTRRK
jgi:hypothetical protein